MPESLSEFRMPALGADMEAGTLVVQRKKPGDRVARGDILAEVETDKGIIEVEVWTSGLLERWLVAPGQKVPVGTALAVLRGDDVTTSTAEPPAPQAPRVAASFASPTEPAAPTVAARPAVAALASPAARRRALELGVSLAALGDGEHTRADVEHAARAGMQPTAAGASTTPTEPGLPKPALSQERAKISPAARRRAAELGVDLAAVQVSSADGVIGLADVERAATAPSPSAAAEVAGPRDPKRALRRAISAAMTRAKREIPHYYVGTTVDLEATMRFVAAYNAERSVTERLVAGAALLRAVAIAAQRMPELNARFEGGEARPSSDVHLGVAISLRGGGLVAPAIAHADKLALPQLMASLAELTARARGGSLRSSELALGTITVTSLGERGVETVFPIIYPPQTAIVGFGRIAERPFVHAGQLCVRPLVNATLAADHRVTDGHVGARFLALVDQLLQEPEKL